MLQKILLDLIKVYQGYIRIFLPVSCRFTPTCSEYAREAISKHGFCKGGIKVTKRLLHCHPFSGRAGYDPLV